MRGCRRHQPRLLDCPTCAGRYARRVARATLASNPRRLFAVEFDTSLSVEQFRSWRTAARNLVDHQRRECRWWRGVSMQVWLGADGRLRGIASLDAITAEEFQQAFRRWAISMKEIEAADLDGAIYAAIEPGRIGVCGQRGYQAVRFALKPQMPTAKRQPVSQAAPTQLLGAMIEPMPVVI